MSKVIVALAAVVCLVAVVPAYAGTFTSNFDNDLEGWYFDGTGTWVASGGQSGGYASHTRDGNIFGWACPTYPGDLNSFVVPGADWNANIGSQIAFEYYVLPPATSTHTRAEVYAAAGGWWTLNLPDFEAGDIGTWKKVSYTVDTNWTDAEAAAAGWVHSGGDVSFANTVRDVRWFSVIGGYAAGMVGIDTFSARAVPEPSTVAMLLLGGLCAFGIYRRR
jgi:hypothetical protein